MIASSSMGSCLGSRTMIHARRIEQCFTGHGQVPWTYAHSLLCSVALHAQARVHGYLSCSTPAGAPMWNAAGVVPVQSGSRRMGTRVKSPDEGGISHGFGIHMGG